MTIVLVSLHNELSNSVSSIQQAVLVYNVQKRAFPQRFKDTEAVEEVTEKVKAVKVEEKAEVKTDVVDEVPVQNV